MPITAFSMAEFSARFPELSATPASYVARQFVSAGRYWRNDGTSETQQQFVQDDLMYLLTAHLVALFAPPTSAGGAAAGAPGSTLVGRINTASEGSVSVGAEYGNQPAGAAFFNQTRYGADAYSTMRIYRTMHYRRGRTRNFNPWPGQW
jgi:hypothetical protein